MILSGNQPIGMSYSRSRNSLESDFDDVEKDSKTKSNSVRYGKDKECTEVDGGMGRPSTAKGWL